MATFAECLLIVAAKAANVAKVCRSDQHLLELLIQQKDDREANARFVRDFKTLADVLIQEMLRHDISAKFPSLVGSIHGEENNEFRNALDKTIVVEVKDTEAETSALLEVVLDGDRHAADLLAREVHREISLESVDGLKCDLPPDEAFDLDDVGIWIDPIDSTAEYINGSASDHSKERGISLSGLECVTILIGVYSKSSGQSIGGIVNQPFTYTDRWTSQIYWGFTGVNYTGSSIQVPVSHPETPEGLTIVLSSVEEPYVREKLTNCRTVDVAGAGYKILTVCSGLSDAYILSKGNTYKWDTCALHAILKSLGGNVIDFNDFLHGKITEVRYDVDYDPRRGTGVCKNAGGLIVYKNEGVLQRIQGLFL